MAAAIQGLPPVVAFVDVDSQRLALERRAREVGYDQGDVPARGDQRVLAINLALPGAMGMSVHVSDHLQAALAHDRP